VTFKPNHVGIGQMLRTDAMLAHMVALAEKVKAEAVVTAPYDPQSKDGTHYKEAFTVSGTKAGGVHKDRAEGKVSNTDVAAFFIEYGTGHSPRHRTLGKALDAARR
jgi:hypothetical protein